MARMRAELRELDGRPRDRGQDEAQQAVADLGGRRGTKADPVGCLEGVGGAEVIVVQRGCAAYGHVAERPYVEGFALGEPGGGSEGEERRLSPGRAARLGLIGAMTLTSCASEALRTRSACLSSEISRLPTTTASRTE